MSVAKICVVTGSRAEFGLLTPLMNALKNDPEIELQLLVTGMHLSAEFGNTYREIEAAGFVMNEKVDMLLSSDSDTAVVKSMGLGMIGYADALDRLAPDWLVVLGDRFEAFSAATAAYMKKIPIAHLHGGEVTSGATDEALRHSISKMSSLHFTSTEEYRKRVLQLGEPDDRVFNVGAIGLDNIRQMPLLDSEQLQHSLNFSFNGTTILITYHPVTLEGNASEQQMQQVLSALDDFGDGKMIFTMPNADANGKVIRTMINDYVTRNPEKSAAFDSLGQQKYLSLMRHASVVVGNSSSGIIEAPSFGIPTVDIGDRQKGRIAAESIIHCTAEKSAIINALRKALDPKYKEFCRQVKNPYGDGDTTDKIITILKKNLFNVSLKKEFVDRA